jgi:hypothetical protein
MSGVGLGRVKTPKLFANGNFVSTSINLKNKSAGDGCRDKTIEKTILRAFRARTFSRSQGQNRKSSMRANVFRCSPDNGHRQDTSACPFRANSGHWSRNCKPRIFAQPTPNQIRKKKIVTIDIPVDMTITDDTVLKCTLYS